MASSLGSLGLKLSQYAVCCDCLGFASSFDRTCVILLALFSPKPWPNKKPKYSSLSVLGKCSKPYNRVVSGAAKNIIRTRGGEPKGHKAG